MRSKTGRSLKKFLSFLLTLSMVLGMLPTIAFAASTRDVTYYEKVTELTDAGEYLIVAESDSKYYALNPTVAATEVTVDTNNRIDSKEDGSAPATVWTATQSGTNWQFMSGDDYLGLTRSGSEKFGYTEYTYSYAVVGSTSSYKTWTLSAGKLSMNVMTEDHWLASNVYADYYLSYNNGTLSATTDSSAATAFTFYQKVTENQTLVGTDANGEVWVKTSTVEDPTAKVVPGDKEGEAWTAANANAAWAAQKVLGIWDATPQYDGQDMETVEDNATVRISLANFPGVQAGNQVTVARWTGNGTWDTATATVAAGLYVETTIKKAETFVVVGPYTLIGTTATAEGDKEVWHYGSAAPTVNVTVVDPGAYTPEDTTAMTAATAAADSKWAGFDRSVYNIVATYGGIVMKKLETPVDVTLDVAGVKKNDAVMVAHWNGSSFDTPIQVKATADDKVTFKADTFSPFVVISGIGYNNITIINTTPGCTITGEGMVMTGTDYTFAVTVDTGYDADDLKVTANGNEFTVGGTKYATDGHGNYTIYAVDDNYTISAIISKTPVVTHTVTFLPGAYDAYIPFSPTTVSVKDGDDCTIPTTIPTREGYTFTGWSDGTDTYDYDSATGTFSPDKITAVSGDVTLNAQWTVQQVNITWPATLPAGVTANSGASIAAVNKGSTVYFTLTLADGYDPSTLVVTAGGQPLAPVKAAANMYQYSFVANADTTVTFAGPSLLTYTVTMPVGHFTAKITAANGSSITPAASASVNYNSSYTFTVAADTGYTIAGVYVNGEKQTGSSPYTVTNVTSAQTVEVVVDAVPSYTVTYVVNDAQYTTQKVTSGETIGTLPENPTVDGYTFNSWNTKQDGSGDAVTAATTVAKDMTVYAQLTAKTYTITYKDGTSVLGTQTKTHGVALPLSATVPTKAGHTFLGWGTTAAATTATYQPGDMYSTDADVTLYAVWQIDTFTVTLPNGTGYTAMPATGSSSPVDYDGDFTFTVTVDPEYAVSGPTVEVNGSTQGATSSSGNTYTYTISNIQENKVVSIQVTRNEVHTVTFMVNGSVYQTQQVEHNAKATVPAPPSVEGYTFEGWYVNLSDTTAYDFGTSVTANLTLNAKMTAITPTVTWTASGTGWSMAVTESTPTGLTIGGTVTYKSDVKFTVTIATGYDATNLAVAANGLALSPVDVTDNVYTFVLPNITEDQKITVVGVARKMITITYNDNGGIGGPVQEQVVYYLSATDCGEISTVEPTRVGYTFLGWATANDANVPAYSNPEVTSTTPAYTTSKVANFTTDTILYAVWSAKATTVTLTVDKASQYEGENVVLTADVTSGTDAVTSGSVQFYRSNNSATPAELIGTAKVSGGKAVLTIATSAYKRGAANTDSYTVKFIPDEGSGYSEKTSTAVTVTVLSAAISWKLTGDNIDTDGNVLTIKDSSDNTVTSMTAGQVYTLELPDIYALDDQSTALVVNKDYTVTWQFCNASGTWEDYTAAAGTDSVKILAEYSQYVFRAVVTPITGATSHFTQAAKYNGIALTANAYEAYLVTEATNPVAQQETKTKLTVTGTHNLGSTIAEFEGQTVTLVATVTLSGSTTKVTTGEVYFYKVGSSDTLIGKANVQTDGTAVLEATISEYDRTGTHTEDEFYAVYQNNATYETSTSDSKEVLIRSTAIAWAGSKALTVDPTGDIYADNQYTLALPSNGIVEDGQSSVILAVGTDYVVSWYMVKADGTLELLAENTESNSYKVTPPTAGVKFYAVVSPKVGSNYTDAYEDSTTKNFLTSDETAASVKAPTITTLTFGDVKTDTGKTPDFSQYEEKTITITAKVVEADLTTQTNAKVPEEVVKSGTVTFYVVTDTSGNYEKIGTATVSNGLATVSYTLPEFALNDGLNNIEYFFAVYSDTAGTYADSNTTSEATIGATLTKDKTDADTEAVQILSTTISWKLDDTNKIVDNPDANKLTIYEGNGTSGNKVDSMTAGSTYTLELPAVYALDDALDDAETAATALTVNKDYTVVWQYREFGASDWNNYPNASAGNTVLITPDYSGYQFQAVVTPVYDNDALTGYKTAAAYDSNDVATGKTNFLVTDPTEKTERQATTTYLTITGADDEAADVVINGANNVFSATHLAQFEGQTVTLEATVIDDATSTGVTVGYVNFYRYVDGTGTGDELLNTTPVEVGANGVAIFEATIADYNTTGTALTNVDKFYAVYLTNATYETSSSVANPAPDEVYIKSTKIQTPVITSAKAGKISGAEAYATTYNDNLTDLLAGVEHTFTLRTGNTVADWSVVALDGRTVADTNYDIQWNVKTGDNTETSTTVGGTFTTTDNKMGDEISVTLNPKVDMTKGATSKKAIIGTKQDVNVTVTASDEITSTPETDVYQLNEITLTATVKAKETNATMQPTGTVTFYYSVNGTAWTKVGETTDLAEVSGVITASIKTTDLPVDATNNTKQNVIITAIYSGDNTFNESGTISGTTITNTTGCTVNNATVTVYSSVVYVDANENTTNTPGADGITISAEEGKVLANETNVNLMLSDVYTLDHAIPLSKLAYGVDYTVQWQKLTNAAAYGGNFADVDTPWVNITGATGVTCQIDVEQGAAYRAVITVKDQPITQGSYTFVDQVYDGRQVYYSNILVAAPAAPTVTVNVNTSNTADGYEGIVEGETVTIHTYTSGASGTTPISELTMTVTELDTDGITPVAVVNEQVKTNVNGHVSFDWTAAKPGYYTLTVNAKFTNGYSDKTITRTLIVRDNDYGFTTAGDNTTYNGKVQGLTVTVDNMGIESDLAQKSVVVYYYDKDNKQVEPTQAGTYKAVIRLQESAYWTEKTMNTTFTIEQRDVSVVDLVAQAKVYDGTTNANIQEIILNDAVTDQTGTGLPTGNTGVINGDSVYAVGTGYTASANAGATTLGVKDVTLMGDDAANYDLVSFSYTEPFNIQRSQVKGDIANSTFKYTGSNITVPADDIYLIDQAGNQLSNYTVTYYYHNGDGVEKVTAMNKLGKYTVIARPEQDNYKGGASQTVYVVSGNGTDAAPTTPTSLTIDITDTVVLYTGTQVGVTAKDSKGNTITDITYNGSTAIPTAAGRYLVKVTASTGDTAYGIYTIVKANPVLELSATGTKYTSAQISGTPTGTFNGAAFPAGTYYTYTGGTIQGVAYEAPTEVGTYIVTAHVPETDNYTAHEISAQFVITPEDLTITADSLQRRQYGTFPDMTASFEGLATGGVAADTSLRDVQIQPELIFNAAYSNDAMDQVGSYTITAAAALARNYEVSYVTGLMTVTEDEPNPELAIHGMIENGNGAENLAYYGDEIQLYAYGSQMGSVINNSSVLTWSVTGPATITNDGLLTITGVGTVVVKLERGVGAQKISTTLTITALKKEVKVRVPNEDVVYNAATQTYTVSNMKTYDEKFNDVTATITSGNISRENVGSQIVTGMVAATETFFQSETYGGLFTINDKEVTVKPNAATTNYGTPVTGLTYTVKDKNDNTVTGVLSNDEAVSVADLYGNLDVGTYEILVAGTEDQNYNVKYETNPVANKVTVNALGLTVSTGTLDENVGMTSGSLNPVGKYPVNGAAVDSTTLGASNVRMYGEPNWVMDYALTTLISGDSLADLVALGSNLVYFNYDIAGHASVTYLDHSNAIDASQYPGYTIPAANQQVVTGDTMMDLVNYTESYALGTQNIYQRPVKLVCNVTETELPKSTSAAALNDILIQNITADKLSGVGGLATLLKHTVANLDLKITYEVSVDGTTWTTVSDFTTLAGYTKVRATISVGNPDYYAEPITVVFDVTPTRYVIEIVSFGQSSASVNLYEYNEDTGTKTLTWFPADSALAAGSASTAMTCKIYNRVNGLSKYADYAYETPVVDAKMIKGYTTGRYTISYSALVGSFRMFAIADGYIIIDNT